MEQKRKEADELYRVGESYLQTSCWKCQTKPSYIDAIPNLKQAADIYHGIRDYGKEKIVRERLAFCFFSTKSFWEEGVEYTKIGDFEIKELGLLDEAYDYIVNANKAFITGKDYPEAIKTMSNFGSIYIDCQNKERAEKILKKGFEDVLKFYHIMTMDKDEPTEFIYKCVDLFIDIKFSEQAIQEAVDNAEKFCKVIETEEGDKKKLVHYYLVMSLGYIMLDHQTYYNFTLQKCKEMKRDEGIDDDGVIEMIDKIYQDFTKGNCSEENVNKKIKDLSYDFSNEILKLLKVKLLGSLSQSNKDKATRIDEQDMGDIGMEHGKEDKFIEGEESDYK